jgi:hypothetical protein
MTKHNRRARCHITAFDELECAIPFHRRLVEEWKDAIPFSRRSYDPQTKAWRFWGGYQDLASSALLEHFPDAEVPRRGRKTHSTADSRAVGSNHFRVLHLRETAPVELIESAYQVLALLCHPDVGGSHEAMQAINGAYAALRERVRA